MTKMPTPTSSLEYYVARICARGLKPHPTFPTSSYDQTLILETPRSRFCPEETTYITYMTSATPITTVRMVLIPAPMSYPDIPREPLYIPMNPHSNISATSVVAQPSTSTDVVQSEPQVITVESSPASPTHAKSPPAIRIPTPPPNCPTTIVLPRAPRKHIYSTIAMLEHNLSPFSSPAPTPPPPTTTSALTTSLPDLRSFEGSSQASIQASATGSEMESQQVSSEPPQQQPSSYKHHTAPGRQV